MVLHLMVQKTSHTDFTPRITVIGVGGGGTNAVDNMIDSNLQGVDFVVANTDAQQLVHSKADRRIQLGPHLTQGLGAGAKPEIGRAAAEEAADELLHCLEGTHMVFITAGMGGGTGTGAAPVIARMAKERGVLTVGVVTKPFTFEGMRRNKAAEQGIAELQQYVDTLIVIPNQNLFRIASERTSWKEAFKLADNVLYMGVRGVTDLMMAPGLVNLDFADIRTVMAEMGKAMMGTGEAEGDDRAVRAAEAAISNPLLEDTSMSGARGLLINITGGDDMTLHEVDQAANRVRSEVSEDANIIFGSAIDEALNGKVRVSVVATGIEVASAEARRPTLVAMPGGAVEANGTTGGASFPHGHHAGAAHSLSGATMSGGASTPAGLHGTGLRARPTLDEAMNALPNHLAARTPDTALIPMPSRPALRPAQPRAGAEPEGYGEEPGDSAASAAAPDRAYPPAQAPLSPPPAAPRSGLSKTLFGVVTSFGRRSAEPEPAEPRRAEPNFSHEPSPVAPQQHFEDPIEIPAFLRRQTSQKNGH